MTSPAHPPLSSLLKTLTSTKARDSTLRRWVVCRGGRGFISVSATERASHLALRAAAGRSLDRRLQPGEVELLYGLGLKQKSVADPFFAAFPAQTEAERRTLSALIEQLMERLYVEEGARPECTLYEAQVPSLDDQPLVEAMRHVSKERSHSARQRLYWAFVRGQHLLALQGEPTARALGPLERPEELINALKGRELEEYSQITGYRSAAVFSTWEGALRCHPDGRHVVEVRGRALLPLLLSRGVASLLINPRGSVGGELYRNELSSMEEAMSEWERR